jgi:predicted ribosome quality control (RQC) complex YloA/Tae2 family protein
MNSDILQRIADGRTDLVFEYVSENRNANSTDQDGVAIIKLLRTRRVSQRAIESENAELAPPATT